MKRTIFILAILLGIGNMLKTMAQSTRDITPGVSIENFNMNREGKYLTVEINLDLNKLNVDANLPYCSRRVWSTEWIRWTYPR